MATFQFTPESVLEIHARSSVHPVEGKTSEIRGQASGELKDGRIDLDQQPSGYFEIPVDALKSGHKLQDLEMRRRIEAKKYPTIRYEVKEVKGGPDTFQVRGALTFHGVTKEFASEVRAKVDNGTLYAEGELTMDIRDFGVQPPKILNLQVYPDVRIVVRLVGKQAGGW